MFMLLGSGEHLFSLLVLLVLVLYVCGGRGRLVYVLLGPGEQSCFFCSCAFVCKGGREGCC